MKEFLIYNNKKIEYILKRSNKKSVSINVKDGQIYVFADMYSKKEFIEKFILANINKLLKNIEITKTVYKNNEKLSIFGKEYTVVFNNTNKDDIILEKDKILVSLNKDEVCLEDFFKNLLMQYLKESFAKYSNLTNLYPKKVTVKKMNSRWGSCSSNGNISISLNLIKFDKNITDYVVLHEICHLKEMNHSKNFWQLVEKYMPDFKYRRYILKNLF